MSTEVTPTTSAATDKEAEKNKLTGTLPPPVMAAIRVKASELSMSPGDWMKLHFTMAWAHPDGVHLKLDKVAVANGDNQPELPLA